MKTRGILLLFSVIAFGSAADKATIADLLAKDTKFDQKAVVVLAKAHKFENKVSRAGNPYFRFRLGTEKEFVSVYGMGKAEQVLKDGDSVEVTGFFRKEKRFGDIVYKNEIEVSKRLDAKYGYKKL